jgi:hypothetical protein
MAPTGNCWESELLSKQMVNVKNINNTINTQKVSIENLHLHNKTHIKKVLGTILRSLNHDEPQSKRLTIKQFEAFFDTYAGKFEKTLTNNGKEYTLKLFKALYDQSVRLVTKEPFLPIPYHKSNKEGVSTLLHPILNNLRGDNYKDIRLILSVTRIYEQIRLKPEVDLTSIETPYRGTRDLDEFTQEFIQFLKCSPYVNELHSSLPKLKGNQNLIGRIRSGPNGQAIVTSHYDAVAVVKNPKLHKSMSTYNYLLSQSHITENME